MGRETTQIEERLNAYRQAAYGFPVAGQEAQQSLKVRPRQYRAILLRRRPTGRRRPRPPLPAAQSQHSHAPGLIIEYPPSPLYISPTPSRPHSPSPSACEDCAEESLDDGPISQGEEPEWRVWQQIRRQAYTGRMVLDQIAGGDIKMGGQESQQSPSTPRPETPPRTVRHLAIRTPCSRENTPARNS
ncbi:hypothetical protein QBC41DRAFT_16249 [Cercophora samala]|uniref:Uncharacterized protein n=1 Tax=Cercophora samala TaxID=330535 RepID=A0AA40D837_9PEZI|nr:hypothetical protein QBC41DRAFT_16249 [Cercophora samala]